MALTILMPLHLVQQQQWNNGTILLTKPGQLNKDTKTFIRENNIKNIIIVGGERSVSKNVENELRGL